MHNPLLILSVLFLSFTANAQRGEKRCEPIYTCNGALNIFEDGDFRLQFQAAGEDHNIMATYSSLGDLSVENLIWVSFVAPHTGELSFNANIEDDFLQMVVFMKERSGICEEIRFGEAEIKRLHIKRDTKFVGLDYEVSGSILYSLFMKEGDQIMVAFATEKEKKSFMNLSWHFHTNEPVEEKKVVDHRYNESLSTIYFKLIDKETHQPVITNLTIEGNRNLEGLYIGSDFYFNIDRTEKLDIKCDTKGFFFFDSTYAVDGSENNDITIELERVRSGKTMVVESIEFVPGTSEVTNASIPNLVRLRDFLALNSEIEIEIQGHVFAPGKNTFAAQRVSEARAKRIYKYLVDNGIDKDRLTILGYGNTEPLYPKPKFYYEEQANRRVEIMVK